MHSCKPLSSLRRMFLAFHQVPRAFSQWGIFRADQYSDFYHCRSGLLIFLKKVLLCLAFSTQDCLWDPSMLLSITVACGFSLLNNTSLGECILNFNIPCWGTLDDFPFGASLNKAAKHILVYVFPRKETLLSILRNRIAGPRVCLVW